VIKVKEKKIPLRKCVITNERLPKKELIRIVKNNENDIFVDLTGKKNGRGAYMKLDKKVIEKAKKSKALNRQFEMEIPESIYQELFELLEKTGEKNG
jgi:predicted RNA-binding protein YlxR (DUF448 family)